MTDCIFCKIRDGVIPSKKYYEDENMFVIADIDPRAKKHFLAIPKNHYKLLADMSDSDREVLGKVFSTIAKISGEVLGLDNGYRLIINQGDDAGQTVPHLHIHIVGGEKLGWEQMSEK